MNTKIKTLRQSWLEKIFYFILASPALFLLVNKYPYFLVLSILVIVFLGLIFFLSKKKISSYHYPVLLVLILIFTYLVISYFMSGQYLSNFFSYRFLRTDGNFFFSYILFFAFAIPFFDYRRVIDYYFKLLFFVFSIFSLLGIFEFIIGTDFMLQGSVDRGRMFMGLNSAHNATGSVYALVSLFALIFFLEEKSKKLKILYSITLLLSIAGLFLSKSRGSYVAFSITAIFVLWMYLKSVKKFSIVLSTLIVISIPVLWVTNTLERFIQIIQATGTTTLRLELWEKAWNLFTSSPIFGVGFGRFNDIRSAIYENLAGQEGILSVFLHPRFYWGADHAHNSYLMFLAEIGIVGLGLIIFFWCFCFQIIIKAWKSARDDYSKRALLAGLASIVNLFILSFSEHYFSSTTIMVPSSMIVSLCIGLAWQINKKTN